MSRSLGWIRCRCPGRFLGWRRCRCSRRASRIFRRCSCRHFWLATLVDTGQATAARLVRVTVLAQARQTSTTLILMRTVIIGVITAILVTPADHSSHVTLGRGWRLCRILGRLCSRGGWSACWIPRRNGWLLCRSLWLTGVLIRTTIESYTAVTIVFAILTRRITLFCRCACRISSRCASRCSSREGRRTARWCSGGLLGRLLCWWGSTWLISRCVCWLSWSRRWEVGRCIRRCVRRKCRRRVCRRVGGLLGRCIRRKISRCICGCVGR